MASGVNIGGVWKDIASASARVSGAWKDVSGIYVKVSGAWQEAWSAYTAITATVTPSSYTDNSAANDSGPYDIGFSCAVTGGNGSETYTWSVSPDNPGDLSILSGEGTDSVTIRIADGNNQIVSGTVECLVSDGVSSDSDTSIVSVTYGVPV